LGLVEEHWLVVQRCDVKKHTAAHLPQLLLLLLLLLLLPLLCRCWRVPEAQHIH
jgi:hypothetical protein